MNEKDHKPKFEVTDHYYLENRGAFVIGNIVSGEFTIGMKIDTTDKISSLTISGIEYVDNISKRSYKNALVFKEYTTIEYLKKAFPTGTIISSYNSDEQYTS